MLLHRPRIFKYDNRAQRVTIKRTSTKRRRSERNKNEMNARDYFSRRAAKRKKNECYPCNIKEFA
eukprot:2260375-Pleurochrysis_carterae.AAC.1